MVFQPNDTVVIDAYPGYLIYSTNKNQQPICVINNGTHVTIKASGSSVLPGLGLNYYFTHDGCPHVHMAFEGELRPISNGEVKMPDFKPGDKVRILPCPEKARNWSRVGGPILPEGDILTVSNETLSPSSDCVPFRYDGKIFLIRKSNVELVTNSRHKCHCPVENFRLNGLGCVCGGE